MDITPVLQQVTPLGNAADLAFCAPSHCMSLAPHATPDSNITEPLLYRCTPASCITAWLHQPRRPLSHWHARQQLHNNNPPPKPSAISLLLGGRRRRLLLWLPRWRLFLGVAGRNGVGPALWCQQQQQAGHRMASATALAADGVQRECARAGGRRCSKRSYAPSAGDAPDMRQTAAATRAHPAWPAPWAAPCSAPATRRA